VRHLPMSELLTQRLGHVRVVTVNRPEARNADERPGRARYRNEKAPESAALWREAAVAGNRRLVACRRWSESLRRSARCSKAFVHDVPTCEEPVERMC
jgi:hypothetical protein